jgi:sugar O-acyltransferase (sialic acid O-acetyltransferase NeuD family)
MNMPKSKVLIVGAGGHAASCIEVIEAEKRYQILGLIGTKDEIGKIHLGHKVISSDNNLNELMKITDKIVLGVGQIKSPQLRIEISDKFIRNGFKFVSVISPNACISKHATIGNGTVIMHGVTINSGVEIGDYSIINTGSIIEHHSKIGNFSHISTGAILNGNSVIGNNSFVGSGTIIMEGIKIGNNCIIGMGQHIRHDVSDNLKFFDR